MLPHSSKKAFSDKSDKSDCLTVEGASQLSNLNLLFRNVASQSIGISLLSLFEGDTFGIQFQYLPHSGYCQPSGDSLLFLANLHFLPNFAIFTKITIFIKTFIRHHIDSRKLGKVVAVRGEEIKECCIQNVNVTHQGMHRNLWHRLVT